MLLQPQITIFNQSRINQTCFMKDSQFFFFIFKRIHFKHNQTSTPFSHFASPSHLIIFPTFPTHIRAINKIGKPVFHSHVVYDILKYEAKSQHFRLVSYFCKFYSQMHTAKPFWLVFQYKTIMCNALSIKILIFTIHWQSRLAEIHKKG